MHCRHHPTCPGCPLLDLPYEAQLQRKRDRLALAFSRYRHLPPVGDVRPATSVEGYRHRLKLPVDIRGDKVTVGLYDEPGGKVLNTPDCPVLHPGLREGLAAVVKWLAGRKGVHSIDLRRSALTGELQLVIACQGGDLHGGAHAVRQLMRAHPALVSVAVSVADPAKRRVVGRGPKIVAGTPHLEEGIGDTRYRLHPGAFFQVDPHNAAQLHGLVKAAVGDAKRVLDLYGGVGAYALMLAEGRERVLCVEEIPQAASAARAMAPPNVEIVKSRVEDLDLRESFDVAILNPARRGSDPTLLARVAELAERLVYVSCGPETLARDLDCLAAHGLRTKSITAVDLFPQTPEVEAVAVLERGPPLAHFAVPGGRANGPWISPWSGAKGHPSRALVLALHDTGDHGSLPGARYKRVGVVATHSLLRLDLQGPLVPALAALARLGHAVAGREPRTKAFFADKAGLVRPFVHVEVAGEATAPLHGDLVQALIELRAPPEVLRRAGVVEG